MSEEHNYDVTSGVVSATEVKPEPEPAADQGELLPKPEPVAAAPSTPVDKVVDDWWHERVHGSMLGHDTATWNYLSSVVEHLRVRLRAFHS